MKIKFIVFALTAAVAFSCASKSATASTNSATPQPVEPQATVALEKTETVKPSKASAEPMTEALMAGKTAYDNNCAKCHKLYEPKEFSKTEWAPILLRMQKKAHLSDAEMAPITNYIYTQL